MRLLDSVMANPRVYQLWQAPFADRKLRPILAAHATAGRKRVLDVACGPGTNAKYFTDADYVGVDINEDYIEYARRRYGRTFVAGDVVTDPLPGPDRFDCILVNSFLHHLEDVAVHRVLLKLRDVLAPDGVIHILELVLPDRNGPARWLARCDRGSHARSLDAWRGLFANVFVLDAFEPYTVGAFGIPLWHMIYGKGALP